MAGRPSTMHLVQNRPATSPVWLNLKSILNIYTDESRVVVLLCGGGVGTSTDAFATFADALAYVQSVIDLIDAVA